MLLQSNSSTLLGVGALGNTTNFLSFLVFMVSINTFNTLESNLQPTSVNIEFDDLKVMTFYLTEFDECNLSHTTYYDSDLGCQIQYNDFVESLPCLENFVEKNNTNTSFELKCSAHYQYFNDDDNGDQGPP